MSILKLLNKIFYFKVAKLSPLENTILAALCDSIDKDESDKLKAQIKMLRIIQRQDNNRIILFFFKNQQELPLLMNRSENFRIASVKYRIDKNSYTSFVVTHRGRLSSIETRKALSCPDLQSKPHDLSVTVVGIAGPGLAEEIDREEHGRM